MKTDETREIGGYFELEHFTGSEYHQGALALNCARNCLAYIIEARHIGSLWIPDYLCRSVESTARRFDINVKTYHIGLDLLPKWDEISLDDDDFFYLVDYYGQIPIAVIEGVASKIGARLIVDEVMAFYRMPLDGIDTIYSCRKFFGVADGAYLYTTASIDRDLPTDESHQRMDFVLGRFERPAHEFYERSTENNAQFIDTDIRLMSPITHNILRAINYDAVARQRQDNFNFLNEVLCDFNELRVTSTYGPFAYPLLCPEGARIRPLLHKQKLYVPLLWDHSQDSSGYAAYLSRNVLPLPVDQRYDVNDMEYVVQILKRVREH